MSDKGLNFKQIVTTESHSNLNWSFYIFIIGVEFHYCDSMCWDFSFRTCLTHSEISFQIKFLVFSAHKQKKKTANSNNEKEMSKLITNVAQVEDKKTQHFK